MKIKEIIVVEGRDDTIAIKQSVDALTIETHGYGIRPDTFDLIDKAYKEVGIIIFTDPDHAGEQIRKRLLARYPEAKEAFLDQNLAYKNGDIGIENASPESIREALAKAQCNVIGEGTGTGADGNAAGRYEWTVADLVEWGLNGGPGAADRRKALGKELGVGFANAKVLLQRLNKFGITREAFEKAICTIDNK